MSDFTEQEQKIISEFLAHLIPIPIDSERSPKNLTGPENAKKRGRPSTKCGFCLNCENPEWKKRCLTLNPSKPKRKGSVPTAPRPPLLKSEQPEVKALMSEIQGMLDKQKTSLKGQYRDKTKKAKFSLKFAFLLGCTTNALGASINKDGTSNFGTPHNMPERKGKGVCLKPVEERKIPKWKKELWVSSRKLIELIDPDFAAGEYVVNYACMDSPEHYVKKHCDSDDISYQYALALGDYTENSAFLRCYDKDDTPVGDFDYKNRILKMDGRRSHELIANDTFSGTRYCVVFFKSYDSRKNKCDPVLETPVFV